MHLALPFFGEQSLNVQNDVVNVLPDFYRYLDPGVVLRNTFTIGSMFRFKDRVPKACCSDIACKRCCFSCRESYIGSTNVHTHKTRVCQQMVISDRTAKIVHTSTSSCQRSSLSVAVPFLCLILTFWIRLIQFFILENLSRYTFSKDKTDT